jgi:hypothetical protein
LFGHIVVLFFIFLNNSAKVEKIQQTHQQVFKSEFLRDFPPCPIAASGNSQFSIGYAELAFLNYFILPLPPK